MREQKGYLFHKGQSWFLRYADSVLVNGAVTRKLVCKKLDVPYGGEYRTKASVKPFVRDLLRPVNAGVLNPASTMPIAQFVDDVYFPQYAETNLRTSTRKHYEQIWNRYLKPRIGQVALRDFRTVHAERLLSDIARQDSLGRHTLKHIKAFLSAIFKQAKRLGILDGINPVMDVSIPRVPEGEDTYAVSLDELHTMRFVLDGVAETKAQTAARATARIVILAAALTGLRKSELRGLRWSDYTGTELYVNRSVWGSEVNETKTRRSKAPIPVVRELAKELNQLRDGMGTLAQPDAPIFQAGNGKPLNLDNLARRTIIPALQGTGTQWHGWHSFRRGVATTLHALGVDDITIQRILRHSSIAITQGIYIKSVSESQVAAMDALNDALLNAEKQNEETCNNLATPQTQLVN